MSNFKIGDWVIWKNTLNSTELTYVKSAEDAETFNIFGGKLWQPEEGEWVFVTDKNKIYLVEFIGMYEKRYVCKHLYGFSETFDSVEPFIGELPSFLKDNHE